jgi:hypothetical protein
MLIAEPAMKVDLRPQRHLFDQGLYSLSDRA